LADRGRGAISRARRAELAAQAPQRRPPWKARGLTRADGVIRFLQSLPVTKGHLQGQKMRLLPEQEAFIRAVYVDDYSVSTGVLSTPKGCGKTGVSAGLGLCHLLGPEAIERGEVYSAAIDRGQAGILFNEMRAIIEAVPDYQRHQALQEDRSLGRRRQRFSL
jgi:phage terminase large subunit-like protein